MALVGGGASTAPQFIIDFRLGAAQHCSHYAPRLVQHYHHAQLWRTMAAIVHTNAGGRDSGAPKTLFSGVEFWLHATVPAKQSYAEKIKVRVGALYDTLTTS